MSQRPNLILIMTDQQRFDTIRSLGAAHMITPHMDALGNRGVRFRKAFCPGATCVASRAAIFTGQFAHNTGAYSFMNWGHHRTWVDDLAGTGYWCANIGKMHLQPRDVSGGFHERIVVENPTSVSTWGGFGDDAWGRHLAFHGAERPNHRHRSDPEWREKFQGVPWHLDRHLHSDIFIGDSAVAWINAWKQDRPLFLQIGFTGPHEPWDPLPEHLAAYDDAILPDPVVFPENLSQKPPQHDALRRFHAGVDHESRIDMPGASLDDIRQMRRHYYAKVTLVDEQVGRVVAALEVKGLLDDSLLILCSDHGELLGEHGMAYKWLMYDDVVRVPLLMVPGKNVATLVCRDEEALVSLIDVGPTFLDAAGVPLSARFEGRSLLPALSGGLPPPEEGLVFCEDNYQLMARSQSHKIVIHLGQEQGEFYDLVADPHERRNLWNSEPAKVERDALRMRTLQWVATSSYLHAGAKCQSPDAPMRWPETGDFRLHGNINQHHKNSCCRPAGIREAEAS